MLIQILLLAVIVFAISRVALRSKSGELRPVESVLWIAFWIAAGIAVLYPGLTVRLANSIGVGRGTDLVSYISFVILFYLVFRIIVRLERIERSVTHVVRQQSLSEAKKTKDTKV